MGGGVWEVAEEVDEVAMPAASCHRESDPSAPIVSHQHGGACAKAKDEALHQVRRTPRLAGEVRAGGRPGARGGAKVRRRAT